MTQLAQGYTASVWPGWHVNPGLLTRKPVPLTNMLQVPCWQPHGWCMKMSLPQDRGPVD